MTVVCSDTQSQLFYSLSFSILTDSSFIYKKLLAYIQPDRKINSQGNNYFSVGLSRHSLK